MSVDVMVCVDCGQEFLLVESAVEHEQSERPRHRVALTVERKPADLDHTEGSK